MDDIVWLTYDDLADRLGIERESARQTVKRKRWARRPGNDGKVRIGVPVEILDGRTDPGTNPGAVPPEAPVQATAVDPVQPDVPEVPAELRVRVAELEDRITELRGDVERERSERIAERERAEHLVGEVATLARDLARATTEAAVRERELHVRAAAAEAALIEYRARPWWRRLTA